MDFIHKNDIAWLKRRKKPRQISRLRNNWPRCGLDINAHRLAENIGKRCLAQSRRPRKEDMIKRFTTRLCGFDGKEKATTNLLLTYETINYELGIAFTPKN